MKKIALFIWAVIALCSCSRDDTDINAPADGQYIYENGNLTVAINVDNTDTGITIFENGSYVYQSLYLPVSGSWPVYRYDYVDLVLDCQYVDNTTFSATVSNNQTEISLPATMLFKLDNRVLDINGDGVLD